jgi:AcrR family transcriptional regulator
MLREDRRRGILDAAKKVFASNGYHATGVADIIAAAGIARGTFYLYFESKRAIFEVLLDEFLELLKERVPRVDETVGLPGIQRQVRENVMGVLALFAEHPDLARLILNEAVGLDKGFDEKLARFWDDLVDIVEASLILGREMGIVRPLDTRLIAAGIVGAVKEVEQRVLRARAKAETLDLDRMVDELLDYHIRALFVPELLTSRTP